MPGKYTRQNVAMMLQEWRAAAVRTEETTMSDPAGILPHGTRCTDAERRSCLAHLRDAHIRGALEPEPFEARVQAALTAVSCSELEALTRDLPGIQVTPSSRLPYVIRALAWGMVPAALASVPAFLLTYGAIAGGFGNNPPGTSGATAGVGILSAIAWVFITCVICATKIGDAIADYQSAGR